MKRPAGRRHCLRPACKPLQKHRKEELYGRCAKAMILTSSTWQGLLEGEQTYEAEQEFFAVASRLAGEGRLSRFACVAEKLG